MLVDTVRFPVEAVTVTLAVCVTATPAIVAETVLVSGVVELSVPVATPLAFVGLAGCVSVFPEPVAASTTVAPLTGLPFASRAVTVSVEVPLPAVIEVGEAVTVDCDADTGPAVTVTVAVCVTVTPLMVAETVFDPATVELKLPVATPLALVGAGWVNVFPEPVADSTTVAPLIGFPLASRAVTVIVDVPLPAVIEVGDAVTVDCDDETGPAVTVTLAVWLSATPPAVAEIVFVPATVDCNVPVATPLELVGLAGCVRVLPEPLALSVTVTPLTGFPFASRAVTVIVDVPLPAVIEVGDAVTVDCEADTPPAVTVTAAVCVIATPLMVAETVFDPATVELKLPVATPLAFVGPAGWVSVLPEPVADSTTVAPLIGFPLASRAVTVIVEVPLPAVIDVGDATTLDCDAETDPVVTVTVAVWVTATPLMVADTVLVSGVVELSEPVAIPLAFVELAGCVSVLPEPVALSVTVAPLTGFPFASRAVTVIVEVPLPAVIEVGDAVTVDCEADTPPAVTVTAAVCVIATPPAVAETVFVPATVELSVPVATPLALVGPAGCVSVLPEPVALSTTLTPLTGFPLASRAVTVIVDVPLPAVIVVGEATTPDCAASTVGGGGGGGGGGGAAPGLSASTLASHVHGVVVVQVGSFWKNQRHCGLTDPPLACTALSASVCMLNESGGATPIVSRFPKPWGGKRLACARDAVTA